MRALIFCLIFNFGSPSFGQVMNKTESFLLSSLYLPCADGTDTCEYAGKIPFLSIEINDQLIHDPNELRRILTVRQLRMYISETNTIKDGVRHFTIKWVNEGQEKIRISNPVPFDVGKDTRYIAGLSFRDTTRSWLFQPDQNPVAVIVPHNNNDLSFSSLELNKEESLFALLVRDKDTIQNYLLFRQPRLLEPGEEIGFHYYFGRKKGSWQEALRYVFQERKLFEVEEFDNRLYRRRDLAYIRKAYTMHLMMAWEKNYYEVENGKYGLKDFLLDKMRLYGGDDIFTIWPSWPVMGLDQRNQWELMANLPGGIAQQRKLAALSHDLNCRYFISYNPWDDDDESESLRTMTRYLKDIDADGVVLDTRAESSDVLQAAADHAKPGIILYSEGMATPRDMQGIIAGRVHNDIYYPPLLNLNKLIQPNFAIFRVVEVNKEPVRREYSLSLFNGHGVEINVMRPGRQDTMEDDYAYWGKCVRILRENGENFNSQDWVPLYPSQERDIFINYWPGKNKNLYTLFSLKPEGFRDTLFRAQSEEGTHFVDLWNHEEIKTLQSEDHEMITADLEAFHSKWLGSNNEGSVSVIAQFPDLIDIDLNEDLLTIRSSAGNKFRLWKGNPGYNNNAIEFTASDTSMHLFECFGRVQGKFVIQAFKDEDLLDERIITLPPGEALLVSTIHRTHPYESAPGGMIYIAPGKFTMEVFHGDGFISYPAKAYPMEIELKGFFLDKYPVTNEMYFQFVQSSGYTPADTVNYLKHWEKGKPVPGEERFPVIYVSYEDAMAFCSWAGKRLPTEAEWQFAAQANDGRYWPWEEPSDTKIQKSQKISTTYELVDYGVPDEEYCNGGDGKLYPVGKYPTGQNPYGLSDLVGSVWQLTNDLYQSDSYEFVIMKGGSYYHPGGSWWYMQGGPKPLPYRQMLLRFYRGFERNASVGFRCAADHSK